MKWLILLIFIYILSKIFSTKNNFEKSDNTEVVQDTIDIEFSKSTQNKNTATFNEKSLIKNLQRLTFNDISEWLEDRTINRNYLSIAIVYSLYVKECLTLTIAARFINKQLKEKAVVEEVVKIYEVLKSIFNDNRLNKEFIYLNYENISINKNFTESEFKLLDKLFEKTLKNETNITFNTKKIIEDLNYLFEIIPKTKNNNFL